MSTRPPSPEDEPQFADLSTAGGVVVERDDGGLDRLAGRCGRLDEAGMGVLRPVALVVGLTTQS